MAFELVGRRWVNSHNPREACRGRSWARGLTVLTTGDQSSARAGPSAAAPSGADLARLAQGWPPSRHKPRAAQRRDGQVSEIGESVFASGNAKAPTRSKVTEPSTAPTIPAATALPAGAFIPIAKASPAAAPSGPQKTP